MGSLEQSSGSPTRIRYSPAVIDRARLGPHSRAASDLRAAARRPRRHSLRQHGPGAQTGDDRLRVPRGEGRITRGRRPGGRHRHRQGFPMVLGRLAEQDPSLPTVTVYNHLDVQPGDGPGWRTPPFTFTPMAKAIAGLDAAPPTTRARRWLPSMGPSWRWSRGAPEHPVPVGAGGGDRAPTSLPVSAPLGR